MMEEASALSALTVINLSLTATNKATDLANRLKSVFGSQKGEARELIIDLKEEVLRAKEAQQEVRGQLLELQKLLQEADERKERRGKYEFHTFEAGGTVLKVKFEQKINETPEYICADCFETEGVFMPLQKFGTGLHCNRCNSAFIYREISPAKNRPNSWTA